MKLKYYLRGVGIGIIFATLVMTVSGLVHKYNISDEYIIKEARLLGMVMKDELKDEGLWTDGDTEEVIGTETELLDDTESGIGFENPSESEGILNSETIPNSEGALNSETVPNSEGALNSETVPNSEGALNSETVPNSEGTWNSETVPNSEGTLNSETLLNSEGTLNSETVPNSENTSNSEVTSESVTPEYATIVVARGDYARQVAEKLYAAGVIDDAEAFRKYMGKKGYAKSIHAGKYKIPTDATYEEICKILAG